jgi:hypothetical protein
VLFGFILIFNGERYIDQILMVELLVLPNAGKSEAP